MKADGVRSLGRYTPAANRPPSVTSILLYKTLSLSPPGIGTEAGKISAAATPTPPRSGALAAETLIVSYPKRRTPGRNPMPSERNVSAWSHDVSAARSAVDVAVTAKTEV